MAHLGNILQTIVEPGLALLPPPMTSDRARVMLLAPGLQESKFEYRWQVVDLSRPEVRGPARGFWQFERGGGVRGVLEHAASGKLAASICRARDVEPTPAAVWPRLADDDLLACVFARLLLWTDPAPLPVLGREEEAWAMYLRNWRPGAYTRGTPAKRAALRKKWTGYYAQAVEIVRYEPNFSRVVSGVTSTEDPQ